MTQVVSITLGQKSQLTGLKWKVGSNLNGNGQPIANETIFNPRTVTMIDEILPTHFVSIEERDTNIEAYAWLKTRPLVDYNPEPEEINGT